MLNWKPPSGTRTKRTLLERKTGVAAPRATPAQQEQTRPRARNPKAAEAAQTAQNILDGARPGRRVGQTGVMPEQSQRPTPRPQTGALNWNPLSKPRTRPDGLVPTPPARPAKAAATPPAGEGKPRRWGRNPRTSGGRGNPLARGLGFGLDLDNI